MTSDQFTYWLQGFAELNEQPPTAEQWKAIRDHLSLVFVKVTPNYDFSKTVGVPYDHARWWMQPITADCTGGIGRGNSDCLTTC